MFSRRAARDRAPISDDASSYDADGDDLDADDLDAGEVDTDDEGPAPRRRWLAARGGRDEPDDPSLKPATMRGTEALYGYVVALELIGVSVLNLTVTHGKGAPAHPPTRLSVIGLIGSIALIGVVRLHHRLIVPFATIIAAFLVTLPKVPNSLTPAHLLALVIPVVYAFLLTQRQRKATTAQTRAGRSATSRATPADRRADAVSRRRARQDAARQGPRPNRRYTPPKAKRPRR
jgi:hypothetical protein